MGHGSAPLEVARHRPSQSVPWTTLGAALGTIAHRMRLNTGAGSAGFQSRDTGSGHVRVHSTRPPAGKSPRSRCLHNPHIIRHGVLQQRIDVGVIQAEGLGNLFPSLVGDLHGVGERGVGQGQEWRSWPPRPACWPRSNGRRLPPRRMVSNGWWALEVSKQPP